MNFILTNFVSYIDKIDLSNKKRISSIFSLLVFVVMLVGHSDTKAYEVCDSIRSCIGRSVHFKVTSGKGAQYIDVDKTTSQNQISDAMTFEAWIRPSEQPSHLQFVAGLWGPSQDKNDVWVLYITPNHELVFEIDNPNEQLGSLDNTIAKTFIGDRYESWFHITAVFDGSTQNADLYLDGELKDRARNSQYPTYQLSSLQNSELQIQIGSSNALSNDNSYRTLLGQLDEIRLWKSVVEPDLIYCRKNLALIGNEEDLLLYYRCNEVKGVYDLCDASGNSNFGRLRSGAITDDNDRRDPDKTFAVPVHNTYIYDTLQCVTTKKYTFKVVDTSGCETRVRMYPYRPDRDQSIYQKFKITPADQWLTRGDTATFEVEVTADFVGTIFTYLYISKYNACDWLVARYPTYITRLTDLNYSTMSLDLGILKAHCIEQPYNDSIVTICNRTSRTANPKDITITGFQTNLPNFFQAIPTQSLPITLKPDECIDVRVRFSSGDTSAVYYDTLMVISDDKCFGSGVIPLKGEVQEVISISSYPGYSRVDTIDFGEVCVNFASKPFNYVWANLIAENITVDTIIVPDQFMSQSFRFPELLESETGYRANYLRFVPTVRGNYLDSIIFVVKSDGCTIRKPVYVKGIGYQAQVEIVESFIDYGVVNVGQESTMSITARNYGDDEVRVVFSLRRGDGYYFPSGRILNLPAGQSRSISLNFRPVIDSIYPDEICMSELKCFQEYCIQLIGEGRLERFVYDPIILRIDNIVGCQSDIGAINIVNNSGSLQILDDFVLDDPSGKFSLESPVTMPTNLSLANGEKYEFIFRYDPNDLTRDRADRAFLRYSTSDGEQWAAQLYGTSVIPRLYLTELTDYGILEVGRSKPDTIRLENISAMDILVTSINVPNGFRLVYPVGQINRPLKPRDTIMVIVNFEPIAPIDYTGFVTANIAEPCTNTIEGFVEGRGEIVPLELALSTISYGFVRPCDCYERELPLFNRSWAFPMTIDSIWIDTVGVANANLDLFTWYSKISPNALIPYDIPSREIDTLVVVFCPNTPSERSNIDNNANLKILAHGSGWNDEYTTFLGGKRMLMMEPVPTVANFPWTRVDTFSIQNFVDINVPEPNVNPAREGLIIDSISFNPPDRVFFATDTNGNKIENYKVDSLNNLRIRLDFKPRFARYYEAKMQIHISEPCFLIDTTVIVTGNGFAPAFGLDLVFEDERELRDTFKIIGCDTLSVPLYTSRELPATLVDIKCRLGYDTTKLEFLGAESEYFDFPCDPYIPNYVHNYSVFGGSEVLVENICNVDSSKAFLIAKFLPKSMERDTFDITLDSISFDTEEVILYNLIAGGDIGTVVILQPELTIGNSADFDSVRVLECAYRDITVYNTGDVPLTVDEAIELPEDVDLFGSVPPLGTILQPNDSAVITLRFCPRRKQELDSVAIARSFDPCFVEDSSSVAGIAYVPDLMFTADISNNFAIPDTITAILGDTITVPIVFEKDFAMIYNDIQYWLNGLRFDVEMNYNPRAMKYLNSKVSIEEEMDVELTTAGLLIYKFHNVDTLRAGELAQSTFLVTVPDTVTTSFFISAKNFDTDSIFFIDPVPIDTDSYLSTNGKCNITYLNYTDILPSLSQNVPNPWSNSTKIIFTTQERANISLRIFKPDGEMIFEALDGNMTFLPGTYEIELSSNEFSSGLYYYVLEAGIFRDIKKMVVVK